MHKLYQKSEIWFAVFWIIIYVIGTSLMDNLSESIGFAKIFSALFHILISLLIIGWITKNNLQRKYGLCKSDLPAKKFLFYIPLLLIASCNLWFGIKFNLPVHETAAYIISMLCVGFLEEIIFRGFLFKAMAKDGLKSAVIFSSITFGIGHIINLVNGSGAELIENLCQVCYAIAFGFMFVIIFHRGGSLWPCIITHSVINSLSVFSNEPAATAITIGTALLLTAIALAYSLFLLLSIRSARYINTKGDA